MENNFIKYATNKITIMVVLFAYILYLLFSNKSFLVVNDLHNQKDVLEKNIIKLKQENEILQKHFLDLEGLQPE